MSQSKVDYHAKYLIYKNKYLNLKNKQKGGANAAQVYSPAQLHQAMMNNYNNNLANGLPVADLSGDTYNVRNWENINLNGNIEDQLKRLINTQFPAWTNGQNFSLTIDANQISRANLEELMYKDTTTGSLPASDHIFLLWEEN